ncbi:MAG: hypothetical protein JSU72_12660 [Deltaproteobacteria bacterium]|nr:MAG: hypothetical protein JSU72_12660 [Deltaproteobacteria bacterium]
MVNSKYTSEQIKTAVDKRDRFLEQHPELKPFQEEIDRRLDAAGNIDNRIAVLKFMMEEQILELYRACMKMREAGKIISDSNPDAANQQRGKTR